MLTQTKVQTSGQHVTSAVEGHDREKQRYVDQLSDKALQVAVDCQFDQLDFFQGDVRTYQPEHLDVLIALHPCDVATDFAIHTRIRLNAGMIMCAPCCHKELRPQLKSPEVLKPMLQFGIHGGQQAEMLTDTIRALLLKAYGYETRVFEFVSHDQQPIATARLLRDNSIGRLAVLKHYRGVGIGRNLMLALVLLLY